MDWFSFIIALSGIIIPFVSNIVNNNHQVKINSQNNECQLNLNNQNNEQLLKSKELDFLYSGKSENLSAYLDNLVTYLDEPTMSNLCQYNISMAKACMFASKNVYSSIEYVNEFILKGRLEKASEALYNDLLPSISKDSFIETRK